MGGRGTIKFAVNHPDKFAAAAVLSAVPVDFSELRPGHECPIMDTENPRMKTIIANAGGFDSYVKSEEMYGQSSTGWPEAAPFPG